MQSNQVNDIGNSLKARPVTVIIALFTLASFFIFKPTTIDVFGNLPHGLSYVLYPFKLIAGSFLHVHAQHLAFNLLIWSLAGYYIEPKVGSKKLLSVVLLASLIGGIAETVLYDSQFIGLSAACYGLIGLIIWYDVARGKALIGFLRGAALTTLFAIADTALNIFASPDHIAYAAHIGGLMAGFLSSLGFGKGGNDEPHRILRPMTEADIKPILEIIYDHDEDDGEDAEKAFAQSLADKYVMEFEGRVMGMTGFRADDHSPNTAWLSFTYIHDYFRKRGNAYWMMLELRNLLEAAGIKRLFIATSDYEDEETGEDIYLAARTFYEDKLNAERELRVDDYYAPGESKYIYSLPVSSDNIEGEAPSPALEAHTARFVGLDEADESDTSYVTLWEEMTPEDTEPKSKLPTKTFNEMIEEVKSYGGKAIFVTLPDYISRNHETELNAAGFKTVGTLTDYFAPGIDEVYWGLYFD